MSKNNRYARLILLTLCGFHLFIAQAFAADKVLEASQLDKTPVSLTPYISFLEDPDHSLTLADVQKSDLETKFKTDPKAKEAIGFGYTSSAYWVRMNLSNSSDQAIVRMLEIDYSRLSNVDFFQIEATGIVKSVITGNVLPASTRAYKNRNFVFSVNLPAHSQHVFYLRVQSAASVIIPARLWTRTAFQTYERNDYASQAWYFGIATAMILFNLLLFIALKDAIYLMYVSFVGFMSFSMAAQNGLAKEFLWPDASAWSDISISAAYSAAFITLLIFMRRMINTKKVIPKFDPIIKIFIGLHILFIIGYLVSINSLVKPSALLFLLTAGRSW